MIFGNKYPSIGPVPLVKNGSENLVENVNREAPSKNKILKSSLVKKKEDHNFHIPSQQSISFEKKNDSHQKKIPEALIKQIFFSPIEGKSNSLMNSAKEDNESNREIILKKEQKKNYFDFFQKKTAKIVESSFMAWFEVILVLTNISAYCIQDFSDRIGNQPDYKRTIISFYLELICNILYVPLFLIKIIALGCFAGSEAYFKSLFNILNTLTIISSFLTYYPNTNISYFFRALRVVRTLLLIQLLKPIRDIALAFTRTLYSIREILFQICFLLVFFSVFGLHLFQGLLESRCRLTKTPVNGLWIANPSIPELCGIKSCPENNYCENPSLYGLPYNHTETDIKALNYGLFNFDSVFNSLLTALSFFSFTGWSKINDIYWTAYSKIIVGVYSITFLFILGLIMMNLLMAGLYEAFVTHAREIKNRHKKNVKETIDEIVELEHLKLKEEKPIRKKRLSTLRKTVVEVKQEIIDDNNQELSEKTSIQNKELDPEVEVTVFYKGFTFTNEPLVNASKLRNNLYNFLLSNTFKYITIVIFMVDIVTLASDNSEITEHYSRILEKIDFAVTWIFFAEILFRLIIFQPKKFFSNYFDILDLLIIVMNIGQIVWNYIHNVDNFYAPYDLGSGIQCLKILRIFRFLVGMSLWKRGAILFMEMIYSLYNTKEFICFFIAIMLNFVLLGRELFSYRVRFVNQDEIPKNIYEGSSPRINYDEIWDAWIATILVFLNEEWHMTMFNFQRTNSKISGLFFITMLLLGTVLMMRMFMMLFINSLLQSQNIKKIFEIPNFFSSSKKFIQNFFRKKIYPEADKFQIICNKIITFFSHRKIISFNQDFYMKTMAEIKSPEITNRFKLNSDSPQTIQKIPNSLSPNLYVSHLKMSMMKTAILKIQLSNFKNQFSGLKGKSLYLFDKSNNFRALIFKIITHKLFQNTMIIFIILSIFILINLNPINQTDTLTADALYIGDCVIVTLYFIEILMKIMVYGFIFNGPQSYMMDIWNTIDMLMFTLTLLGTVDAKFHFSEYDFKWCRALRVFKIIQYTPGLKLAMYNLFLSVPDIISLLTFFFMNLFFFGVIATKYLKNTLNYCSGLNDVQLKYAFTKWDCFDYGGDWLPNDFAFDNIYHSLSTLMQISTTEGWMEIMFNGWDHVGPNINPVTNFNKGIAAFYIAFFMIANLILMNMIIGILVQTYLHQKEKNDPASKFSADQKEWSKIKEYIYKLSPKVQRSLPENGIRLCVFRFTKSKKYNNAILFLIMLNTLVFMLSWHRQPPEMKDALEYINAIFISIFSIEIVLNFIRQGPKLFFKKIWNVFDVVIISASWIGFVFIFNSEFNHLRWVYNLANCIQVLRIIRVIKKIKFLKNLFGILVSTLPQIQNIFFLMLLLLITYSLIGVNFFAFLKPQKTVGGENIHFREFFIGLVNLARVATGEGWNLLLSDCARKMQPNFVCFDIENYSDYQKHGLQGCGNIIAYFYFFSFMVINTLLILNLFVAMILNAAEEHKRSIRRTNEYRLNEIITLWKIYDPKGLGYIHFKDFYTFYKKIAIKFGVEVRDFINPENRSIFLKVCSIPIYENLREKNYCVRFHDCLCKLGQMAVFLNFGLKDLEPPEGFYHLIKYEIKIVQNKDFELTKFHSHDMEYLLKILKILHNKTLHKFKIRKKKIQNFHDIVLMLVSNQRLKKKRPAKARNFF